MPLSPTILANLKLALTLATADTNNTSPATMADPSTISQSDEPFVHLGSHREELSNLQLQDPTFKEIHKYLSADSNKSTLRQLSVRDQTRILDLARHCVILDGLVLLLTIDGTDGITPFFLMFGRNATSPETVAVQLSNQPIDKNDYAKYLVQRITEAHKLFCSIKKYFRRRQRDYYDLSANPREFTVGQEVLVRKPPPSNVEKGSATKLIKRYAGPYIITKRLKNSDFF